MKKTNRFERFCLHNRDKGIPNLMLYIAIGSGIVYVMSLINGGSALYYYLCFDKAAILRGQVWRLFTCLFVMGSTGNLLLDIVFLYFYYSLGHAVEQQIGRFKFNLYYLGGLVLMDIFAMISCPTETAVISGYIVLPEYFTYMVYDRMASYLHLSLILAYATTNPHVSFRILFIIPVRAWVLALVYLLLTAIEVFNMCYPAMLFPHCLFPLVGLLNYSLFFGRDMWNLLPLSWQVKLQKRKIIKAQKKRGRTEPIPFRKGDYAAPPVNYKHRCTVCGRTDVSDPTLEFRYCSRCAGYHCYCIDHISNHSHIE